MATKTRPYDQADAAYERGIKGQPMTEAQKRAAEADPEVEMAWREGRADREEPEAPKTSTSSGTSSGTGKSKSTSTTATTARAPAGTPSAPRQQLAKRRTPVSRRRSTGGRAYRGARRAAAGAGGQLWHLVVLALGLVALYLVLTNVGTVSGVVGILQKGVRWLMSPTATA